jgi:hypothetical protein
MTYAEFIATVNARRKRERQEYNAKITRSWALATFIRPPKDKTIYLRDYLISEEPEHKKEVSPAATLAYFKGLVAALGGEVVVKK